MFFANFQIDATKKTTVNCKNYHNLENKKAFILL